MRAFQASFDKIETTIEFNKEWANGTGYYDHCVTDELHLVPGQLAKSEDEYGRRMIIVGTVFGNAVAFERFAPKDGVRSNVIVTNVPREVRAFVRDGALDEDVIIDHFTFKTNNIGTKLDWVVMQANKIQARLQAA